MKNRILFGQVWKTIKDYKITEPYSAQRGCIIPKNTRVVVLNTPRRGAIGFNIMPLTSKGLDNKLVLNLKQMELDKEGFGVTILITRFEKAFVLDDNQKIEFDNADVAKFWKTIVEHTDPVLEKLLAELDNKSVKKFISENP